MHRCWRECHFRAAYQEMEEGERRVVEGRVGGPTWISRGETFGAAWLVLLWPRTSSYSIAIVLFATLSLVQTQRRLRPPHPPLRGATSRSRVRQGLRKLDSVRLYGFACPRRRGKPSRTLVLRLQSPISLLTSTPFSSSLHPLLYDSPPLSSSSTGAVWRSRALQCPRKLD